MISYSWHQHAGSFGSVRKCCRRHADGTEKVFAMKIIDKKKISRHTSFLHAPGGELIRCTGLDLIYNEISVMRRLYHRNIVLLFEVSVSVTLTVVYFRNWPLDQVIDDPDDYAINMVMEYLPCGTSMMYISIEKRFKWCNFDNRESESDSYAPEDVAQRWIGELLEALNYIHEKGICHRDIKPENLLINGDGTLRLADFGCASVIDLHSNPRGLVTSTVGTTAFWAPDCIQQNGAGSVCALI